MKMSSASGLAILNLFLLGTISCGTGGKSKAHDELSDPFLETDRGETETNDSDDSDDSLIDIETPPVPVCDLGDLTVDNKLVLESSLFCSAYQAESLRLKAGADLVIAADLTLDTSKYTDSLGSSLSFTKGAKVINSGTSTDSRMIMASAQITIESAVFVDFVVNVFNQENNTIDDLTVVSSNKVVGLVGWEVSMDFQSVKNLTLVGFEDPLPLSIPYFLLEELQTSGLNIIQEKEFEVAINSLAAGDRIQNLTLRDYGYRYVIGDGSLHLAIESLIVEPGVTIVNYGEAEVKIQAKNIDIGGDSENPVVFKSKDGEEWRPIILNMPVRELKVEGLDIRIGKDSTDYCPSIFKSGRYSNIFTGGVIDVSNVSRTAPILLIKIDGLYESLLVSTNNADEITQPIIGVVEDNYDVMRNALNIESDTTSDDLVLRKCESDL